jgi:hypothetical protein
MSLRRWVLAPAIALAAFTAETGADPPRYGANLDAAVQQSDQGFGGHISSFGPVLYNEEGMLFGDVRFGGIVDEFATFSAGLGVRRITHDGWIVGGYGYFDTANLTLDSNVNQGVLGVELMNVDWAFRLNGYLPGGKVLRAGNPRAVIRDGRLLILHPRTGAYPGTDFEVGAVLMDWKEGDVEWWAHLGGYYFGRGEEGFQTITGPRLRTELRFYEFQWLGTQSRVVLTGQYQWDKVRQSQGLVSLGVRMAFGGGKSSTLSRIQRRMVDPVGRLIGPVVETGGWTEPARYGNQTFLRATVITARTGNPARVVERLGENSIALFSGSAGPIEVSETIRLNNRQLAIAGGPVSVPLVGERSGVEVSLRAPGPPAQIVGIDPGQDVFQLPESGGGIGGLEISGGRNGIAGRGASLYSIIGNRISEAVRSTDPSAAPGSGHGIFLEQPGRGVVAHNTLEHNHVGLRTVGKHHGSLEDNHVSQNASSGIEVEGRLEGSLLNSVIRENGSHGIVIGGWVGMHIDGNTAEKNGGDGILVRGLVGGAVTGNTFAANAGSGIQVEGQVLERIENNTAVGNDEWGIQAGEALSVRENVANENGGGISVDVVLSAIEENVANHNRHQGIMSRDVGYIERNEVIGNGTAGEPGSNAGIHISGEIPAARSGNPGRIADNDARDNHGPGILLELRGGQEVLARGNVMSGNNNGHAEFVVGRSGGSAQEIRVRLRNNISANAVFGGVNFESLDPQVRLINEGDNAGRIDP